MKEVFEQYEEVAEEKQAAAELWTLSLKSDVILVKTTLSPLSIVNDVIKKICKKNFPNIKDPENWCLCYEPGRIYK